MEEVARNVVRVKIRPLPTLLTRIRKTWEVEWENTLGQSNFIRVDKVSLFNTLNVRTRPAPEKTVIVDFLNPVTLYIWTEDDMTVVGNR